MKKMRRTYVQPTSEVVELHVTNQLLQASGVESTRSGYDGTTEETWENN